MGCTDSSSGCTGLLHVRLAGKWVAYDKVARTRDKDTTRIEVRSLRTGKRLHKWSAGRVGPDPIYATTFDIVLTAKGSLGWIVSISGGTSGPPAQLEVRKIDRKGSVLLDSGADIGERSLKLTGSRMSWTRAGQTRTAILR